MGAFLLALTVLSLAAVVGCAIGDEWDRRQTARRLAGPVRMATFGPARRSGRNWR